MKKLIFILLILAPCFLFAEPIAKISLEYNLFSETEFEGALVLPAFAHNSPEVIIGTIPQQSADKNAFSESPITDFDKGIQTWKINKFENGIYQFYVSTSFSDDDFSENSTVEWENIQINIAVSGNSSLTILPSEGDGLVWHAFDIIGVTKQIIEVNKILPRRKIVYGNIMDAVSGEPIADATVQLSEIGTNDTIAKCKSDSNGNYLFAVPIGHFLVTFAKEDYIPYSSEIEMWENEFPIRIDGHLSSILTKLQLRIVLSWGANPPDLDAHLIGPDPKSEKNFHVSYHNMKLFKDQHFLDRDDLNQYGPETITLNKLDPGNYTFFVRNYSDRNDPNSKNLSFSNACVRIYREDKLVREISISPNQTGTVWQVLQIDGRNGKIQTINHVE